MQRGDIPRPRSRVAAERGTSHPRSGIAAERRYPMFRVRSSGQEDIPNVQSKGNPTKMVDTERKHQRADRLKP